MSTEIVLGVDNRGDYQPALSLLQRLQFPEAHLSLVHVANEQLPFPSIFEKNSTSEEQYAKVTANLGHIALREATNVSCSKEFPCDAKMVHGNPAEKLVQEAQSLRADLIAINTKRHGIARSSYIGSVGRALTIGSHTSLLLAKGEQGKRRVFFAVFATDHSAYSERCLERLIELAPAGLEEIVVVSAWEIDDREAEILGKNLASLGGDVERWIEEALSEKNRIACAKLEKSGYRTRSWVRKGNPNEVIHRAMEEARADILIIGSQGSATTETSMIGSVALHQATAEFYPVLVVRPNES